MHIQSCLDPQVIYNRYTREKVVTACRHCPSCVNQKRYEWSQRLLEESRHHRYSVFFTLSVDDSNTEFVRVIDNHLILDGVDIADIRPFLNHDITYLPDGSDVTCTTPVWMYLKRRNVLPVVDKREVQKFMKRLRWHINKDFSQINDIYSNEIRYFICSEYGPLTFRPHYHGILFFDRPQIGRDLYSYLCSAWPYGNITWSFAGQEKFNYCSKYVASVDMLPSLYDVKEIKPFYLASRRPAIGCYSDNSKEAKELFFSASPTISRWTGKEYCDVPLFSALENRLFGKCVKFNSLSHSDRVILYGLSQNDIAKERYRLIKSQKIQIVSDGHFKRRFTTDCLIEDDCQFVSAFQLSRHALKLCDLYNITLNDYVIQVEKYWYNKAQFQLRNFYEFQIEYLKEGQLPSDLIHLYDNFVNCFGSSVSDLFIFRDWLKTFGIEFDFYSDGYDFNFNKFCRDYDIENVKEYQNWKSLSNVCLSDSMKSKKVNDMGKYRHKHHLAIDLSNNKFNYINKVV